MAGPLAGQQGCTDLHHSTPLIRVSDFRDLLGLGTIVRKVHPTSDVPVDPG
jgi:hypothetical protein